MCIQELQGPVPNHAIPRVSNTQTLESDQRSPCPHVGRTHTQRAVRVRSRLGFGSARIRQATVRAVLSRKLNMQAERTSQSDRKFGQTVRIAVPEGLALACSRRVFDHRV